MKSGDLQKLAELQDLLNDMVSELRFRGCDEHHCLFVRARAANEWLQKAKEKPE